MKKEQTIKKNLLSDELNKKKMSHIRTYYNKTVGNNNLFYFLRYEFVTLFFGNISGGLGYSLRKKFYARLFKKFGHGVILGKGIVLRQPHRIVIGNGSAIDDYTLLDAGGIVDQSVNIGNKVIISRNCVIQGKSGSVRIGYKTDIGCNTIISSSSGVDIGSYTLIGGNCYIGGGRYYTARVDIPMIEQGIFTKGPVVIGDDVWLGAGAVVIDGVKIGTGCIVGAGAVVTTDLPDYAVAVGVPAVIKRYRNE